jgi:hypothetical protein
MQESLGICNVDWLTKNLVIDDDDSVRHQNRAKRPKRQHLAVHRGPFVGNDSFEIPLR